MKKSEKTASEAAQHAWMALLSFAATVAIACGVPSVILSGNGSPSGLAVAVALGALVVALFGLSAAIVLTLESIRLARKSIRESRHEYHRAVRLR